MAISNARRVQILNIVENLWQDFLATRKHFSDALDTVLEFARPSQHNKKIMIDFFRFCANMFATDIDINRLKRTSIIPYQLSTIFSSYLGKPASWLIFYQSIPFIVIDEELINNHLTMADIQRTKNRLTLHEIGHLVLHWKALLKDQQGESVQLALSATPIQESEAWWFCYLMIGSWVDIIAENNKQQPLNADDQIWCLNSF